MTTTTRNATPATGLQMMQFVRTLMTQLIDTLSDEQLTHQPFPGGNHALWIMGHAAYADDYFVGKLTGADSALPETWATTFGHGSEPTGDASSYPPVADVREAFETHHQRLVDWVEGLDENAANGPSPEGWEMFGPTKAFLPGFFASHEAMHVGQLTVVRKSLGMKPVNA